MKLTVRNKRIAAFVGVVIIGISIGIGFSLTNKEKFVTNLEKMVHEKNIYRCAHGDDDNSLSWV